MERYPRTQIDLLRHGECDGGAIFRGTTDVSITSKGFGDMGAACDGAQRVSEGGWDVIVTSPLRRCCVFAEKLASDNGLSLVVEPTLAEMHFGDWEGKKIQWVLDNFPDEMASWSESPDQFEPPNGESVVALFTRVQSIFDVLVERFQSKRILIVTHGGVIRVLLAHLLDMPLSSVNRFDVPYASMTRFAFFHQEQNDIIKLLSHNAFPSIIQA